MEKKLIPIEENIYLLPGIRSCNIYFFDFKKKAIIDTGYSSEIKDNIELLEIKGLEIKNIDYIINTHSHGDHVGGNSFLKKINPSSKIIGSENTKSYQDERKKISLLDGAEDEFENYEIDSIVKENDLIDLGGCVLKVIATPGHTRDSLTFYIENKNIAFTGDVVYYRVVSQVDYYQDLLKSLSELKEKIGRAHV
jgi:glyoxylase-like metal-dependent hydrolase (beta-lactamase superfamily II)